MSLWCAFATERQNYVYDTSSNRILAVEPPVVEVLNGALPHPAAGEGCEADEVAREAVAAARDEGLLRQRPYQIRSFPCEEAQGQIAGLLAHGPDQLVLNVTEACNLRCAYCTYSGAYPHHRSHSKRQMPAAVARAAVAWYLNHPRRQQFTIGFYGGEPLLRLPLLRALVAQARAIVGERVHFSVTTNGTLIDENAARFLIEADFGLTISLDGPEAVHDRYRRTGAGRGTFGTVWHAVNLLRRLDERYFRERVQFNVVLAPPVDLDALDAFFAAHPDIFRGSNVMTAPLNPQPSAVAVRLAGATDPSLAQAQRTQLWQHFEEELAADTRQQRPLPWAQLSRDFVPLHQREMSSLPETIPTHGQCLPGARKCFVDTDGTFFMCERVAPAWPIGSVEEGFVAEKILAVVEAYDAFFSTHCGTCWAVRLCAKCVNSIRISDALDPTRRQAFCDNQRRYWRGLLTRYCAAREQRDDAFAWAQEIEIR